MAKDVIKISYTNQSGITSQADIDQLVMKLQTLGYKQVYKENGQTLSLIYILEK
ncbi:hypothetical protein [Bacillus sp. AFS017274]|uniref:hypothetical protein n=1 Tax=Bacillaceae TaxID=186817 RepID=UPI0015CF0723|nr:hypothetical protein [Bacillus sp. AFS017274]